MKVLLLISILPLMASCMLMPPSPTQHSRPMPEAVSDLDNLEMLLLNEQQPIYTNTRQLSGTDNLRVGMQKTRVQRYLGQPSLVEVAGNPVYGNERWIYEKTIPTMDGYYQEKRVIYFEDGAVVGWESH